MAGRRRGRPLARARGSAEQTVAARGLVEAPELGLDPEPRQLAHARDLGAEHQQVQEREQDQQACVRREPELLALTHSDSADPGLERDREGDHERDRARARKARDQHREPVQDWIERAAEAPGLRSTAA